MARYQPAPEGKDPELWDIAQKRASFKRHALTYVIINAFLWAIWLLSSSRHWGMNDIDNNHIPWPLWSTLGWGIGLAFHYANAYIFPQTNSIEKEYEKLKNNK